MDKEFPDRVIQAGDSIAQIFGTFGNPRFESTLSWHNSLRASTHMRGEMNRQGVITEAGIAAFENHGEVAGALAVKAHVGEDQIKLDMRIVDQAGTVLVEWEGVEIVDGAQITWVFSDTGNLRIVMDPIIQDGIA